MFSVSLWSINYKRISLLLISITKDKYDFFTIVDYVGKE